MNAIPPNAVVPVILLLGVIVIISIDVLHRKLTAPKKKRVLTISSDDQSREYVWNLLAQQECPECHAHDTIMQTARGGEALNVQCTACQTRYWCSSTYLMPIAYKIGQY